MEKESILTGFEDIFEAQRNGELPTFSEVMEAHPGICEEEIGWYYESLVKEYRENKGRESDENNTSV